MLQPCTCSHERNFTFVTSSLWTDDTLWLFALLHWRMRVSLYRHSRGSAGMTVRGDEQGPTAQSAERQQNSSHYQSNYEACVCLFMIMPVCTACTRFHEWIPNRMWLFVCLVHRALSDFVCESFGTQQPTVFNFSVSRSAALLRPCWPADYSFNKSGKKSNCSHFTELVVVVLSPPDLLVPQWSRCLEFWHDLHQWQLKV